MKICLTTPNHAGPNGGLRLINDFVSSLMDLDHTVLLLDESIRVNKGYIITPQTFQRQCYDLVICCSPHSIWTKRVTNHDRFVVWAQMAEHLWSNSKGFSEQCEEWYAHDDVVVNSEWLAKFIPKAKVCRTWLPSYFKPMDPRPKFFDILLESPFSSNPTKDVDRLAFRAAEYLKKKYGAKVMGYGARPLNFNHKFLVLPELHVLKNLYATSGLLFKATKYDGAACAPIEAARYGCVTVRALDNGDDWLDSDYGWRCKYHDSFISLAERAYNEYKANSDMHDVIVHHLKEFANSYTFENFIKEFSERINLKLY